VPRRKRKSKLRPKLPSRVKKTRTKRGARTRGQHQELWGLGSVALGLFLGAVLYFGWNGGYVGGWLGDGLDKLVGDARYVLPVALVALGALVVTKSELVDVRPFRTGLGVLGTGLMITLGRDQGGYVGQLLGGAFLIAIGATGSLMLGVLLMLVGSLLLSGASLGAILRRSGRGLHLAARRARQRSRTTGTRYRDETVTPPPAPLLHAPPVDAVSAFPDVVGEGALPPHAGAQPRPLQTEPPTLLDDQQALFDEVTSENVEYELPDSGVLRTSPERTDESGETAARVAELLVQTLAHFGVDATVIGQISGPRVTRYELQLAPGTKVAKVAALKDDLSYALATTEIRILAPIPGKQAVGVELPNLSPNLVTLGDIFEPLPATASPVSVWLGKDISGAAVWTDLARMPHLLIAGTTGSGKSGCLNALLTSVLLRATPDDVRLILIDPKRIELSHFESVPHLLTPVVSSPKEASAVLANCLAEMERRYERLSSVRARNINEASRRCPTSS
jgi:DNA segregation ATPase FtsK/SpoIIIE, S-DNA-T family